MMLAALAASIVFCCLQVFPFVMTSGQCYLFVPASVPLCYVCLMLSGIAWYCSKTAPGRQNIDVC
jgi:hypothetical protein